MTDAELTQRLTDWTDQLNDRKSRLDTKIRVLVEDVASVLHKDVFKQALADLPADDVLTPPQRALVSPHREQTNTLCEVLNIMQTAVLAVINDADRQRFMEMDPDARSAAIADAGLRGPWPSLLIEAGVLGEFGRRLGAMGSVRRDGGTIKIGRAWDEAW